MKVKRLLFILIALAVVSCVRDDSGSGITDNDDNPGLPTGLFDDDIIPGVIRIKLEESAFGQMSIETRSDGFSTGLPDLDELAAQLGATRIEKTFGEPGKYEPRWRKAGLHLWYDIYFDEDIPVTRAFRDFGSMQGIAIAEPMVKIERIPFSTSATYTGEELAALSGSAQSSSHPSGFSDPQLGAQWHYYNDGTLPLAVAGSDINLVEAWKINTGHPEVIVCIVDDGIDYRHEDLAANMWINRAEMNGTDGVDDDDNGYVDDIYGWNFYHNTPNISAGTHGTHVAGTVAAVSNNATGVAGIAGGNGTENSGVKLISAQIFYGNDSASESRIARAIVYGADNGAVISQNSWGRMIYISQSVKDAIDYFCTYAGMDETGEVQVGPMQGGIFIAAAGNSSTYAMHMPAGYEKAFSVISMGPDYLIAPYSNYGKWCQVTAPGGNTYIGNEYGVLSTIPNNKYAFNHGTSMACPHVSGIAALAVSHFGAERYGFTAEMLWDILYDSVNDIYAYNSSNFEGMLGSGYIDAYKVLSADVEYPDSPPREVTSLTAKWNFNSVNLEWNAVRDKNEGTAPYYDIILFQGHTDDVNFGNLPEGAVMQTVPAGNITSGEKLQATFKELSVNAPYSIAIVSRNSSGLRSAVSVLTGNTLNKVPFSQTIYTTLNIPYTMNMKDHFGNNANLTFAVTDFDRDMLQFSIWPNGYYIYVTPAKYGKSEIMIRVTDGEGISLDNVVTSVCRDNSREVDLFPNPVVDILNIRMGPDVEGSIKVDITNGKGIKMFSKQLDISPAVPATVDMSGMGPGTYTVEVTHGGLTVKKTIAKL